MFTASNTSFSGLNHGEFMKEIVSWTVQIQILPIWLTIVIDKFLLFLHCLEPFLLNRAVHVGISHSQLFLHVALTECIITRICRHYNKFSQELSNGLFGSALLY